MAGTIHFAAKPKMNRETLDRWCERGILFLVLSILVFGPLAMGAVDPWAVLVIQGLTIGVMILWVLRLWFSPKPQLFWPPICWVVLAFAIYAVGRYVTADIEYIARLEMIQVLMYAFLFFAIVNNLHQQKSAQVVSLTLIFLAAGISGYAVYQLLTHSSHVWDLVSPYPGRASGTYISPDHFAAFLEMILPLAFSYALLGRVKPVTRALLIYAAASILAGLAVTFSRGGWVAAAIGLLALLGILMRHQNHRLRASLVLIALVLAIGGTIGAAKYLATTPNYFRRIDKLESFTQLTWDSRRDMWVAALQMWRDHFWWGVGPALYDYRFGQYRPESMQLRPLRAHNDYLNLLADWGTVGGVIVLTGMIVFGASLMRTWKYVRPPENDFGRGLSDRSAFFLGASTGLLALAVHSLVDFNLHIPADAVLGVTLLALLSSNLRFATERYWVKAGFPIKTLMTSVLAAGIPYLGWQEGRLGQEQFWLIRAHRVPEFSYTRVAALIKAFAVEPKNFQTANDIGEIYRVRSFNDEENYKNLARIAMDWYGRGIKLDQYDAYNYLGYGMCLDWLGRHVEAGRYFKRVEALDPNSYYTVAYIGWHYVQTGDNAAARSWLLRSIRLHWQENVIASSYLKIVERELIDNASSQSRLLADF
ncbi:MAG TPA: O-antigen ligase family protein [Candidatus Saccharimonadales bacterium]|nr:O-antigen ligase family protein [Candidatus Saccharimonadales bacterium]